MFHSPEIHYLLLLPLPLPSYLTFYYYLLVVMNSVLITFLFVKNIKINNKSIEGSGAYLEDGELKQITFKGFMGPDSLVSEFDKNTIIQTTGRFVMEDGKEYMC